MNKAWPSYMNVRCICCSTVLPALLKFEAFIIKASNFSDICQAFGVIIYLLELKGGEGGRSVGLFYCLILFVFATTFTKENFFSSKKVVKLLLRRLQICKIKIKITLQVWLVARDIYISLTCFYC
jgi:hypothetical protein